MKPHRRLDYARLSAAKLAQAAREDEMLIIIVGDMFAAGFDTSSIASRLIVPEAAAMAALRVARERQINPAPARWPIAKRETAGIAERGR